MCGIAGLIMLDGSPTSRDVIQRMTDALVHRGPDDEGVYEAGSVSLGFRRLSILDLSPSGHQPMSTSDGGVTIVFNGEIYNFIELRAELEAKGRVFASSGDTEVLLQAYCEWGKECLSRLNGMWAFLIHDKRRQVVFGSRDRFGIKPLFRYRSGNANLFASEIKAIRASSLYNGSTNRRTAASYLLEGRLDETKETFFEDICHVGAGTAFELDMRGNFREWKYWSFDEIADEPPSKPDEAFAELFEDAVRLHMRSDVPVGISLSGGLDSTSIMCASARIRAATGAVGDLQALCYMTPEYDETKYINETLSQAGAKLWKVSSTAESVWADFSKMLWYQDEPVHGMPALIGFQLMKLARQQGLKVMLNGQGADETIGGYHAYFRDYWHTLLMSGRPLFTLGEIKSYASGNGGSRLVLALRQLRHLVLSQMGRLSSYQSLRRRYHRARPLNPWFSPEFAKLLPSEPNVNSNGADLDRVLIDSITRTPLPLYLRVEDRNSMAHSVEARLPFLDVRLVTMLFTLDPDWKLHGPWNKYVLRQAMRGRIPESVRTRIDKMGFPVPWSGWVANELHEPIGDVLSSRRARESGLYDMKAIMRDFELCRKGDVELGSRLFNVVAFECWAGLSTHAPS